MTNVVGDRFFVDFSIRIMPLGQAGGKSNSHFEINQMFFSQPLVSPCTCLEALTMFNGIDPWFFSKNYRAYRPV